MELGHSEITRYNGGDFPGIARNAYGLLGAGSVLFEIMGQIEGSPGINIGQKAIGMLKNNVRELIMAVLEATADNSLYQEEPDQVDTLLLDNDGFDPNPHLE